MTKASDNAFPSILITEGTEPSAPAAGKQRLYIDSTSHHIKRTDSSGTDVDLETNQTSGGMATDSLWDAAGDLAVGTGANTAAKLTLGAAGTRLMSDGSTAVWKSTPYAINRLTSGDVSITATTNVYASNVTGLGDITLAAVTNDVIEIGVSAIAPNTTGQSIKFDGCTVVSAAAVNFLSSANGTGHANGVSAWYCAASVISKAGGSVLYVAQSGDLSGGNIVIRLICFGSGTRTIGASTTNNLIFWARNHRG